MFEGMKNVCHLFLLILSVLDLTFSCLSFLAGKQKDMKHFSWPLFLSDCTEDTVQRPSLLERTDTYRKPEKTW